MLIGDFGPESDGNVGCFASKQSGVLLSDEVVRS